MTLATLVYEARSHLVLLLLRRLIQEMGGVAVGGSSKLASRVQKEAYAWGTAFIKRRDAIQASTQQEKGRIASLFRLD